MRRASLAAVLLPALVLGSTITPITLEKRVQIADRVVLAQVLESRTELLNGDVRKMVTHTEVLVGEVLKGPAATVASGRITITQLGGKHGLWEAHVPGDPTFAPGETALLFLKCSPTPDRCGLVGLSEGRVPLIGGDAFVFDLTKNQYTKRSAAQLIEQVRGAAAAVPAAPTLLPGRIAK